MSKPLTVTLLAPVRDSFSGYGYAANSLLRTLQAVPKDLVSDITVVDNSTRSFSHSKGSDVSIVMCNPWSLINDRLFRMLTEKALTSSKRKLLYLLWETTPLPPSWDGLLNGGLFDGFVCPSQFMMALASQASKRSAYHVPILVDTSEIPVVDIEEKKREERFFTVLFVGQSTVRKGLMDAVISYSRALGHLPECKMVIKYHCLGNRDIDTDTLIYHCALTNTLQSGGGIYVMSDNMPRDEMLRLYKTSSILLFPTRGEGFGLPPAEAMSAGIPVIYTDWSASAEVSQGPGNYPVAYHMDEAHSMLHHGYEDGLSYAVPSIRALIQSLRQAHALWTKDRGEYYKSVSLNRSYIEERYGMRNTLEMATAMLSAFCGE